MARASDSLPTRNHRLQRWQRKLDQLTEGTPEYARHLKTKPKVDIPPKTTRKPAAGKRHKKIKAKDWSKFKVYQQR